MALPHHVTPTLTTWCHLLEHCRRYVAADINWAALATADSGAHAASLSALLARVVDLLHTVRCGALCGRAAVRVRVHVRVQECLRALQAVVCSVRGHALVQACRSHGVASEAQLPWQNEAKFARKHGNSSTNPHCRSTNKSLHTHACTHTQVVSIAAPPLSSQSEGVGAGEVDAADLASACLMACTDTQ